MLNTANYYKEDQTKRPTKGRKAKTRRRPWSWRHAKTSNSVLSKERGKDDKRCKKSCGEAAKKRTVGEGNKGPHAKGGVTWEKKGKQLKVRWGGRNWSLWKRRRGGGGGEKRDNPKESKKKKTGKRVL